MRAAKFVVRAFNEEVCAKYGIADGDLASLVLRTADNLRHIHTLAEPFPVVAACADTAIDLLLQPPVTDEPDFG
ncbi:MAG: hypothetical protein CSB33_05680 [Desulfobacterales bacterium]|nr:MAG: hypothetical protein CSB33_05680 [Desulfobacterales bacterium]